MWTSFFTSEPVVDWDSANKCDRQLYGKFFHAMLDEGVYLAPSQFEAAFVSLAHTDEIIEQTIEAARKPFAVVQIRRLIRVICDGLKPVRSILNFDPLPGFARDADPAAMLFHDLLHDRQTQSGAALLR